MGETSKRLHDKLKRMARPLKLPTGNRPARADMPSVEKFIRDGLDPVHAVYVFMQNITSFFGEGVSQLPEMKAWAKVVAKAEEEYMPSGPPMSPLTASFFTSWAFYDLKIGTGSDTLGTCLIDANDVVMLNPYQLEALKKLCDSRMGTYEHIGMDGDHVRLRDLLTEEEFVCLSTTGYQGRSGELWYVRLLPPLEPELARYHVVFTTPYVLTQATAGDWTQYLRRSVLRVGAEDEKSALHRLMKNGLGLNHWNEFVLRAYHHHRPDAIYLAGIPDLKHTLPHA